MVFFLRKAIRDIRQNIILNLASIATIALTVMIAGGMLFFYINAGAVLSSWVAGVRIMAYIAPGMEGKEIRHLKTEISAFSQVEAVRFIPRDEALDMMKELMENQASIFDDLPDNPLPDAFEVRIRRDEKSVTREVDRFKETAQKIAVLSGIEEVEYSGSWLKRFQAVVALFRLAGYFLVGMVVFAGIFFVGNTIRLILYSRREEVEIMRLVGASDAFIHTPFYIQGMLQGFLGSVTGIFILFGMFRYVSVHGPSMLAAQDPIGRLSFLEGTALKLLFLPPFMMVSIICISMVVGWFGSYLSLQRFFRLSV